MELSGKEIRGFLEYSYDNWFNQRTGPDDSRNGSGGHLTRGADIPKEELAAIMLSSTIKDLRYYLTKWIEENKVVKPKAQGNWKVVPTDWLRKARETDYKLLYEGQQK